MPRFVFRGHGYNNPVELALAILGGKLKNVNHVPACWSKIRHSRHPVHRIRISFRAAVPCSEFTSAQ